MYKCDARVLSDELVVNFSGFFPPSEAQAILIRTFEENEKH